MFVREHSGVMLGLHHQALPVCVSRPLQQTSLLAACSGRALHGRRTARSCVVRFIKDDQYEAAAAAAAMAATAAKPAPATAPSVAAAAPDQPAAAADAKAAEVWRVSDGNAMAAAVAYALSDTAFVYPITPATPMAEACDQAAAAGRTNLYGNVMKVVQMEGEGGVAAAMHGALQAGGLPVTFTCSQGLLLMIPNMYRIAGELLPGVMHVATRTVASHGIALFGDHQDVMGVRQTGWAMLCAADVQEAQDLALVAHLSALAASTPFVHFFDGFLTSHEMRKVRVLKQEALRPLLALVQPAIAAHRAAALSPQHPQQRGSGMGHELLFQSLEAANPYYQAVPGVVESMMAAVERVTGRHLGLFEYEGHPQAERVVVAMGSGCQVLAEAVQHLVQQGEKVGVVKVRLFRPWSAAHFLTALPASVSRVAVLDRCKEPGSLGEPLYLDVAGSLTKAEAAGSRRQIQVVGGRYGLGGKVFTPAMAAAVYKNLAAEQPADGFTVGIEDDITHLSLEVGPDINCLPPGTHEAVFWGLGSDGSVGAVREAAKILGEAAEGTHVQASFGFDPHKSGALTVSSLRFGPLPISSTYPITAADYVGVGRAAYLTRYTAALLGGLKPGGTLLVNAPWTSRQDIEAALPPAVLGQLAALRPRLFAIDAAAVAASVGLGGHINMVMQSAFFKLMPDGLLPFERAMELLKQSICSAYSRQGQHVVNKNIAAVDAALAALREIPVPAEDWAHAAALAAAAADLSAAGDGALTAAAAPEPADSRVVSLQGYAARIMTPMLNLKGDKVPVSAITPGNYLPPGTSALEKRGIAAAVPAWSPASCTQCNTCSFICPHAAIRPVIATAEELAAGSPRGFGSTPLKLPVSSSAAAAAGKEELRQQYHYRVQVSPADCTGCRLCESLCPSQALSMLPLSAALAAGEDQCWEFAKGLPNRSHLFDRFTLRGSQFQQPLMEFSGACEGCGETPYVKLLTQLFGERLIIANACGCSSVWGGWTPTNPYTVNASGHGPAWTTSLLEDNAQFGFGIATAITQRRQEVARLVRWLLDCGREDGTSLACADSMPVGGSSSSSSSHTAVLGPDLRDVLGEWLRVKDNNLLCQAAVGVLRPLLVAAAAAPGAAPELTLLVEGPLSDLLEKPSIWLVGGDGWAYDIGFAGLDHVVASGEDVNILVLDTECYSNTGGQQSKATPLGAVTSLAASGKSRPKKDLGMMMMEAYGSHAYVASVCLEANYNQVLKVFAEAEAHQGVSLIVAYAPCQMHGITSGMKCSAAAAKRAVATGYWPLWHYYPPLAATPGGDDSVAQQQEAAMPGRLVLDSRQGGLAGGPQLDEFLGQQNRFNILSRSRPGASAVLHQQLQQQISAREARLQELAGAHHKLQQEGHVAEAEGDASSAQGSSSA